MWDFEENAKKFVERFDSFSIENGILKTKYFNEFDFLQWDIHIIFCDIWKCPILYFRVFDQTGSPIKISVPATQCQHPVYNVPFYFIHPCQTNSIIKEVNPSDPLLFFVSTMQQVLKIVLINNKNILL
jgi:hypothetical protein